ncbi:recombinase family protein [Streptomyces mirabilis]|uniref:recombinase family protein n=1 Tax=Streptomyces mirabilis TaxID=68239 RepID=UPI0036EFA2C5
MIGILAVLAAAGYRGTQLSYREIASVLEAEGIWPKRGERWHPETVRRMLANTGDQPPTLRKR